MRRIAVLAPILALVAVLVARRRRRRSEPSLEPAPGRPVLAALPAPPPRFVSVPWTLVAAPEDQAELTIRCHQDAHVVLDRVDVQETPTQVFVTVLGRWQPQTEAEPARGEAEETVPLSRPLGARELIHAPIDDEPARPPLYP